MLARELASQRFDSTASTTLGGGIDASRDAESGTVGAASTILMRTCTVPARDVAAMFKRPTPSTR